MSWLRKLKPGTEEFATCSGCVPEPHAALRSCWVHAFAGDRVDAFVGHASEAELMELKDSEPSGAHAEEIAAWTDCALGPCAALGSSWVHAITGDRVDVYVEHSNREDSELKVLMHSEPSLLQAEGFAAWTGIKLGPCAALGEGTGLAPW